MTTAVKRGVPILLLRAGLAGLVALLAGYGLSWNFWSMPGRAAGIGSDFAQLYGAAGVWANGGEPYESVGPGKAVEWAFPLLYPFTAVLLALPFTAFSRQMADALFAATGAGLFAWAISGQREYRHAFWAIPSSTFVIAVLYSQWSPIMAAAALLPVFGWILAAKPTVAVALLVGYPTRLAVLGITAIVVLSLLLMPSWPLKWLANLPSATHMAAPVQYRGGFLLLLAWLKWRRPEARLLGALALIPHTTLAYEALPLFLIPKNLLEGALLCGLSWLIPINNPVNGGTPEYDQWLHMAGERIVWAMYLPSLAMVLRRPNTSSNTEAGIEDELSRRTDVSSFRRLVGLTGNWARCAHRPVADD